MKRIQLKYLIFLISSATLILVMLLLYQAFQLYEKRSEELNGHIENVLNKVAIRHEKASDLQQYTSFFSDDFSGQYKKALKQEFQNLVPVKETVSIKDTTIFEGGRDVKYLYVTGESYDSLTQVTAKHSVLARDISDLSSYINQAGSGEVAVKDSTDLAFQLDKRVVTSLFKKSKYINELMVSAFRNTDMLNASERVNLAFLDSIIDKTFEVEELEAIYNYVITNENDEIVIFPSFSNRYNLDIDIDKTTKVKLFPGNIFDEDLILNVYFPNRKSMLIQEIGIAILVSFLLIVLVVLLFYIMFKMIIDQRRLATVKSDFINNMTHEFKTPISTISLACEAISDVDMHVNDISSIVPFVRMIDEENKRLGGLVEQILNTTVLDKGHVKMKLENLELNQIVDSAVQKAKIGVQNGAIHTDLSLSALPFQGDGVHINNMISNLLDNAIKYSKEKVDISVKTEKISNEKYKLIVCDKGIGIKNEHLDKIFDKLYRVPTGNVHNVKGYGLGLNYVKAIADLHGWEISVKSKYGEGTCFTVTIINVNNYE